MQAHDLDAAEAEHGRITTPADRPVSDRVPAPGVNPPLEEPPRTRLVFDRVARVVGHSLRSLMDAQDRLEVGGDWMTQSQPRGPQLAVRPLRCHSSHASGGCSRPLPSADSTGSRSCARADARRSSSWRCSVDSQSPVPTFGTTATSTGPASPWRISWLRCLTPNPGACPRTTISTPRLVCPWLDPRSHQHGTQTWVQLCATEVSQCTKKPSSEVSWTRSGPEGIMASRT